MNRSRQFLHGLGSSWFATASTVVYSLLSVPIALRYLSVDEFGLFVLLIQVATYFALIEIGMSAATARILMDHKDSRDGGGYGSVILTSFLVFGIQALLVLIVGLVAAPFIIAAIGVPSMLAETAVFLLRWLAVTSALAIALRTYTSVLYANKRLDLIHAFNGGNILLSLAILAFTLTSGGGLRGLAFLFVVQTLIGILLPIAASHRLRLLPEKGCWGTASKERFRELFVYGKNIFLVNIGNQVVEASQLIIVTRTMGLSEAAVWSVSTKLFSLVYQLVTKLEGTAIVFFAEMMVRGERRKLATRFRHIYQLTAGLAVVALAFMIAVNKAFVSVWAEPSLAWSLPLSVLAAAIVFLNSLTRCGGDLIVHTKSIAAFRYVFFVEAIVFVGLALALSTKFGFYGILGASLVCLVAFRATYTTWRMARYFELPAIMFWWDWLKRSLLSALILLPFAWSSGWIGSGISSPKVQLIIAAVWIGIPAAVTFSLIVFPSDVKEELAHRWPQLPFLRKR